jgi:hypothetical protein
VVSPCGSLGVGVAALSLGQLVAFMSGRAAMGITWALPLLAR